MKILTERLKPAIFYFQSKTPKRVINKNPVIGEWEKAMQEIVGIVQTSHTQLLSGGETCTAAGSDASDT